MSKNKEHINYSKQNLTRIMFWSSLIFLFLPIFSVILYSFNDSKRITIWRGFTLENYVKVFYETDLRDAFINSLFIALVATVFSIILGVMSSYLFWRFKFIGKSIYTSLLGIPIIIPEICMGVSLLIFFNSMFGSIAIDGSWPLNLTFIIISHITFCFPFVSIIVTTRMVLFSREQLDAAFDLGAGEIKAFFDIVIPFLKPAIIAGGMLAFTLSLDDFVITFFTSGPNSITFPVKIYSMLRFSVTPVVNAASTILIVLTIILAVMGLLLQKKSIN